MRIAWTFVFTAPLGALLGAFMPLGLATVSRLAPQKPAYLAWGWAVNGFFSVIGSVLTTILAMTIGFRAVLLLGLAAYGVATLALRSVPFRAKLPS